MKIVIDTNVIISGIFFHGAPSILLENTLNDFYTIVLSEGIVAEYKEVVTRYCKKKKISELSSQLGIIDLLINNAFFIGADDIVTPPCADPDDVKFLQAAIAAKAKYLISGDKDLLDVKEYTGGHVLKTQEFLKILT